MEIQTQEPVEQQVEETQAPSEPVVTPDPPSAPDPDAGLSTFQKKIKEGAAKVEGNLPPAKPVVEPTDPAKVGAPSVPALPPYSPNLKFKVMDKEHDVPELLKPLLKDAKSEAQVRELLEKAYGLDIVKPKLQEERTARRQVETQHSQLMTSVNDLKTTYNRGDLDGFFQKLNIPQERVLQWCLDKVNYSKLPPEQRQVLDAQKSAEERAWAAEQQVQTSQTQQQQQLAQAVQHALDLALTQPDVKPAADAYDARVGKPGAFRDEVARRGEYYWVTQGKLIPPDQAAREVLGLVGTAPAQAPAPQVPAAQAPAAPAAPPKQEPPVIPNISGSGKSPTPHKPKSLDDIKKIYKEMQKQA